MNDKKENILKRIFKSIFKVKEKSTNDKENFDSIESNGNIKEEIKGGDFLLNSRPIDDGECYKNYKKDEI